MFMSDASSEDELQSFSQETVALEGSIVGVTVVKLNFASLSHSTPYPETIDIEFSQGTRTSAATEEAEGHCSPAQRPVPESFTYS